MIKLSIFLKRRSDLSHEQFIDYWVNKHAPMLLALPEFRNYVHRYVQQHPSESPPNMPIAPYDGIAELWFDDIGKASEAFGHEIYQTTVVPDEDKFVDRANMTMLITQEQTIL